MLPAFRPPELAPTPLLCPPAAAGVLRPDLCPAALDRALDEIELRVRAGTVTNLLICWQLLEPILLPPAAGSVQ
jgi:hypothetical protein